MRRFREQAVESLTELGLTALEAEVYAALVKESPATAYKLAQTLGKAAANVYKAVDSLARKGAIVVDDGESRLLRAVPAAELLHRFERNFRSAHERADHALRRLAGNDQDERVYRLQTREQVIERAAAMLARAKKLVALDVFPEPFEDLRADIERAAARGVRTLVQVYAPLAEDIEGADVIVALRGDSMLRLWSGQWLNVVVDASEHLLALMHSERGDVVQAIWTSSSYLSVIYFSGLDAEMRNATLHAQIEAGASPSELKRTIREWSKDDAKLPGVIALQKRLRSGA